MEDTVVPDDLFDEEYGEHAATLCGTSPTATQPTKAGGRIERPEPLGGAGERPIASEQLYATTWDEETMLAKARRTSTGR